MTVNRRTIAVCCGKATGCERLVFSDPQERALENLLGRLPPAARVLDLGCGPGLQAARMAAGGHRVEAIDATPAFVEAALARIARALKPGGFLFLGLKLGTGEGRDDQGRLYTYYSEAELRRHLGRHGCRIAEVETGSGRGLSGADEPFILILAHG